MVRGRDVVIIGGGIVGTAAAAFLARAGTRVTLYDREECGRIHLPGARARP